DDVADVHEVAALLAGPVAVAALEQPRLARSRDLVVQMERDARHLPLVRLAGSVDVEVPQADDGRPAAPPRAAAAAAALGEPPAHVLIEQQLRIAVHVQG